MGDEGPLKLPGTLLFDLDGTLLDSLPGIRHSAHAAFEACGLEVGDVDLRSLIGPPIRTILAHMARAHGSGGPSDADLDRLEKAFRASYDGEGWKMTPHYPGAVELLREMRANGKRLFVVSNKPRHISVKILEAQGTMGLFKEIATRDSRDPWFKDKREMMHSLVERHDLQLQDSMMIGDTMEDAEAASDIGMKFCLMTHGYGDVPDGSDAPVHFRFDHFSQLMPILAQEQSID